MTRARAKVRMLGGQSRLGGLEPHDARTREHGKMQPS